MIISNFQGSFFSPIWMYLHLVLSSWKPPSDDFSSSLKSVFELLFSNPQQVQQWLFTFIQLLAVCRFVYLFLHPRPLFTILPGRKIAGRKYYRRCLARRFNKEGLNWTDTFGIGEVFRKQSTDQDDYQSVMKSKKGKMTMKGLCGDLIFTILFVLSSLSIWIQTVTVHPDQVCKFGFLLNQIQLQFQGFHGLLLISLVVFLVGLKRLKPLYKAFRQVYQFGSRQTRFLWFQWSLLGRMALSAVDDWISMNFFFNSFMVFNLLLWEFRCSLILLSFFFSSRSKLRFNFLILLNDLQLIMKLFRVLFFTLCIHFDSFISISASDDLSFMIYFLFLRSSLHLRGFLSTKVQQKKACERLEKIYKDRTWGVKMAVRELRLKRKDERDQKEKEAIEKEKIEKKEKLEALNIQKELEKAKSQNASQYNQSENKGYNKIKFLLSTSIISKVTFGSGYLSILGRFVLEFVPLLLRDENLTFHSRVSSLLGVLQASTFLIYIFTRILSGSSAFFNSHNGVYRPLKPLRGGADPSFPFWGESPSVNDFGSFVTRLFTIGDGNCFFWALLRSLILAHIAGNEESGQVLKEVDIEMRARARKGFKSGNTAAAALRQVVIKRFEKMIRYDDMLLEIKNSTIAPQSLTFLSMEDPLFIGKPTSSFLEREFYKHLCSIDPRKQYIDVEMAPLLCSLVGLDINLEFGATLCLLPVISTRRSSNVAGMFFARSHFETTIPQDSNTVLIQKLYEDYHSELCKLESRLESEIPAVQATAEEIVAAGEALKFAANTELASTSANGNASSSSTSSFNTSRPSGFTSQLLSAQAARLAATPVPTNPSPANKKQKINSSSSSSSSPAAPKILPKPKRVNKSGSSRPRPSKESPVPKAQVPSPASLESTSILPQVSSSITLPGTGSSNSGLLPNYIINNSNSSNQNTTSSTFDPSAAPIFTSSASHSEASIPDSNFSTSNLTQAQVLNVQNSNSSSSQSPLRSSLRPLQEKVIKWMAATLPTEQRKGYEQLRKRRGVTLPLNPRDRGGVINLGTGQGKTRLSIHRLAQDQRKGVDLIVVPNDLVGSEWVKEWAKSVLPEGNRQIKLWSDLYFTREPLVILITEHELRAAVKLSVGPEHPHSLSKNFRNVIVDEAHSLRNRGLLSEAIQRVQSLNPDSLLWLLTGTVMVNSRDDAAALFELLGCSVSENNLPKKAARKAREDLAMLAWRFFCFSSQEPKSNVKPKEVILRNSKEGEEVYRPVHKKLVSSIGNFDRISASKAERVLNDLTLDAKSKPNSSLQLSDFPKISYVLKEVMKQKLGRARNGLPPRQFLVYSKNPRLLQLAAVAAQLMGIPSSVIVGKSSQELPQESLDVVSKFSKGISEAQACNLTLRQDVIDAQKRASSRSSGRYVPAQLEKQVVPEILFMSDSLGTEGLNLFSASMIFILSSGWAPATRQQIIARADRPGQKEVVGVHLVLIEDTVDEFLNNTVKSKEVMIKSVYEKLQLPFDQLMALVEGETVGDGSNGIDTVMEDFDQDLRVESCHSEDVEEEEQTQADDDDELSNDNSIDFSVEISSPKSSGQSSLDSMDLDQDSISSSANTSVASHASEDEVERFMLAVNGQEVQEWERFCRSQTLAREEIGELEWEGTEFSSAREAFETLSKEAEEAGEEREIIDENCNKRASAEAKESVRASGDDDLISILLNPTSHDLSHSSISSPHPRQKHFLENFESLHNPRSSRPKLSIENICKPFKDLSIKLFNTYKHFGVEVQQEDMVQDFTFEKLRTSALDAFKSFFSVRGAVIVFGTYSLVSLNIGGSTLSPGLLCHTFQILKSFGKDLGSPISKNALFTDSIGLAASVPEFEAFWKALPREAFLNLFKAAWERNKALEPRFIMVMGDKNKQGFIEIHKHEWKNFFSMSQYFNGAHVLAHWNPNSDQPPYFIGFVDHLSVINPQRFSKESVERSIKNLYRMNKCIKHVKSGKLNEEFPTIGEEEYKQSHLYKEHFPTGNFVFGALTSFIDRLRAIRTEEIFTFTAKPFGEFSSYEQNQLLSFFNMTPAALKDYKGSRMVDDPSRKWSLAFEYLSRKGVDLHKFTLNYLVNLERKLNSVQDENEKLQEDYLRKRKWLKQRAFALSLKNELPSSLSQSLKSGDDNDFFHLLKQSKTEEKKKQQSSKVQATKVGERKRKRVEGEDDDLPCGFGGCKATFRDSDALKAHQDKKHPQSEPREKEKVKCEKDNGCGCGGLFVRLGGHLANQRRKQENQVNPKPKSTEVKCEEGNGCGCGGSFVSLPGHLANQKRKSKEVNCEEGNGCGCGKSFVNMASHLSAQLRLQKKREGNYVDSNKESEKRGGEKGEKLKDVPRRPRDDLDSGYLNDQELVIVKKKREKQHRDVQQRLDRPLDMSFI